MADVSAEHDYIDVVSSDVIEYGVRDWSGDILTMPEWTSAADVVAAMHAHGYTGTRREDVIARTTTHTVSSTGWEAAS